MSHESARQGVGAAEDGEAAAWDAGLGSRLSGSTRIVHVASSRSIQGKPAKPLEGTLSVAASFQKASRPGRELRRCSQSPVSSSAAQPDTADTNDTSTNKATAFSVSTTSGDGFLGSSVQTFASIYGFVANWAIQPGLRTLNV